MSKLKYTLDIALTSSNCTCTLWLSREMSDVVYNMGKNVFFRDIFLEQKTVNVILFNLHHHFTYLWSCVRRGGVLSSSSSVVWWLFVAKGWWTAGGRLMDEVDFNCLGFSFWFFWSGLAHFVWALLLGFWALPGRFGHGP